MTPRPTRATIRRRWHSRTGREARGPPREQSAIAIDKNRVTRPCERAADRVIGRVRHTDIPRRLERPRVTPRPGDLEAQATADDNGVRMRGARPKPDRAIVGAMGGPVGSVGRKGKDAAPPRRPAVDRIPGPISERTRQSEESASDVGGAARRPVDASATRERARLAGPTTRRTATLTSRRNAATSP